MTLKEAYIISIGTYGPTSLFTLSDWFKARDIVKANYSAVKKIIDQKDKE